MDNTNNSEENKTYIDGLYKSGSCEIKSLENKKKKKRKWLKAFLICAGVIFIVIVGGTGVFCGLKIKGESNLKTEEQYITYNGEKYKYKEGIVNILCLGIDKGARMSYIEANRGNIGMSDAIVLVSIDTEKNEMKAIEIPRETVTEVQKTTENGALDSKERMRLCIQYAYGKSMQQSNELTVEAVSNLLYGVQIQRCCAINLNAVSVINDAVGGVDVEVLEDIEKLEPRLPYGETVHLEGGLALRFIQIRNKDIFEGAMLRTQRQKQYALAFIEKAKDVVKKNPMLPITVFQKLQKDGKMYTDISAEDIAYLVPEVLQISFSDDMIQMLPGESVVGEEDGRTEYHIDTDAAKRLIIDTFYEKA